MKNRNIPYYVAALMLAAGVSTSFVSCVDTEEPDSIAELRKAKAEEVKAEAEFQKALAAVQNAEAELKLAEKAEMAAKAKSAEFEASIKELDLAKRKALDAIDIAKAQAAAETLNEESKLKAEKARVEAEAALEEAKQKALRDAEEYAVKLEEAKLKAKVAAAKLEVYGVDDELKEYVTAYENALDNVDAAVAAVKDAIQLSIEGGDKETFEGLVASAKTELEEAKQAKTDFENKVANSAYKIEEWQKIYDDNKKIIDDNTPTKNDLSFKYEAAVKAYNDAVTAKTNAENGYNYGLTEVKKLNGADVKIKDTDQGFSLEIGNSKLVEKIDPTALAKWGFKLSDGKIVVDNSVKFKTSDKSEEVEQAMSSKKSVLCNDVYINGTKVKPLAELAKYLKSFYNKFAESDAKTAYIEHLLETNIADDAYLDGFHKDGEEYKWNAPAYVKYTWDKDLKDYKEITNTTTGQFVHVTYGDVKTYISDWQKAAAAVEKALTDGKDLDEKYKALKDACKNLFGTATPLKGRPILKLYAEEKGTFAEDDQKNIFNETEWQLPEACPFNKYIEMNRVEVGGDEAYTLYAKATELGNTVQGIVDTYKTDKDAAEAKDKTQKEAAVATALGDRKVDDLKKAATDLKKELSDIDTKVSRATAINGIITGTAFSGIEGDNNTVDLSADKAGIKNKGLGENDNTLDKATEMTLVVGSQYETTKTAILKYLNTAINEAETKVAKKEALLAAYNAAVAAVEKGDFEAIDQDQISLNDESVVTAIKKRINDIIKAQETDEKLNLKTAQENLARTKKDLDKAKKFYE